MQYILYHACEKQNTLQVSPYMFPTIGQFPTTLLCNSLNLVSSFEQNKVHCPYNYDIIISLHPTGSSRPGLYLRVGVW